MPANRTAYTAALNSPRSAFYAVTAERFVNVALKALDSIV